jgi:hypothetical protein
MMGYTPEPTFEMPCTCKKQGRNNGSTKFTEKASAAVAPNELYHRKYSAAILGMDL